MADIRVFPIGYISTGNTTSKGAWTAGGTAVNELFEPNNGCNKTKVGFVARSNMENRAIWTRTVGEHRNHLEYNYKNIFNWEFKQIRRFMRDLAEFGATSFYVIDFSSGQKISALTISTNINASIYDTTDFTATSGEGGNYACIWDPVDKKFRIGIIDSKNEDSYIQFPNSTDFGNLTTFTGGRVFAYPMYRCYLSGPTEDFKVTAFVDPVGLNASFAGPVRSGTVKFTQRDVK